ncbi:hypothetical protein H4R99_004805 [Coemansia sp. RSA 1722]|nr:hypothetical protein LPJ57_000842 [Coemansia sp. RSA 486]KAJ2235281.1 hypothetical protein IWW45_002728 [Coemansia sp. RSA 485]KAJ2596720.1 hypothetical protein H4R99_004805 [Coemansia sp. RSA 1722]KAJ2600682.1 hypothetical protein GGF39_001648 [Coemansia sp. RSA 1721]KAJ2637488.1 hypothetical protein GGF40_002318 [Coemansia sp. RSA 1286]
MAIVGLSAGRSRRQNAGNKMHAMIEEERAKMQTNQTAESDDEDFRKPLDDDDMVDSDFAETDSEDEKAQDIQNKAAEEIQERAERRQQRKDAKKRMIVPRFASTTTARKPAGRELKKPQEVHIGSKKARNKTGDHALAVRVSSRSSAVRKAQETEALEQEREFMAEIKRGRKRRRSTTGSTKHGMLTQEQLLEEAKQTEIENLEKLQIYQDQEAEDKLWQRRMAARKAPLIIHPIAHFRSFSKKTEDASAGESENSRILQTEYALDKLDDTKYPLDPWKRQVSVYPLKICPVTGLPARYFHPKARVPYANARAYRILEEMVLGEHAFFYDIGAWSSTAIGDN